MARDLATRNGQINVLVCVCGRDGPRSGGPAAPLRCGRVFVPVRVRVRAHVHGTRLSKVACQIRQVPETV